MKLAEVRRWAFDAHGTQRYGPHPYSFHLEAVEAVAIRFGFGSVKIRKSCLLHDVQEDTDKTAADMRAVGIEEDVIAISSAVTDEPGANRKERKQRTYPKIRILRDAVIVKLCDRIANVEFSLATDGRTAPMYKREFAEFELQLRDRDDLEVEVLWLHLEQLLSRVPGPAVA
jgi:guanosine-3',5'-bis(diphosphate) 3'-pyrophosphohydrolase